MTKARIASVYGPKSSTGNTAQGVSIDLVSEIRGHESAQTQKERSPYSSCWVANRGPGYLVTTCNILTCCYKHNTYVIVTTSAEIHFLLHQACRNHSFSDID